MWLTSKTPIVQATTGEFITCCNQLYEGDDGVIYLVPRSTQTDGYTIPLDISHTKYDIRPATLHDIGCRYRSLIVVNLPIEEVKNKYLFEDCKGNILCKDIPIEYLEVKKVKFNFLNNLFYKAMVDVGISILPSILYRIGVGFNIGYLFTRNNSININNIYTNILIT